MKDLQQNNKSSFKDLIPEDILEDIERVEEIIKDCYSVEPILIGKVGKHVMESGGKRLRPLLHLLCTRLFEYRGKDCITVAACSELVHSSTLLHDDVIDYALTRRGKPSANVLWGNKSSILVGDYLFAQCLSMLLDIGKNDITSAFAKVFRDLSVGEMLELANEHNLDISFEEYFEIINKKTSSLFKLCMETGHLYNNSKIYNGDLGEFGTNFGVTFQLVDDYLDYFGEAERMGKPIMGDFNEKKVTLPLIHLLKLCSEKEKESIKELFLQLRINETEELLIKGLMRKYRVNEIVLNQAREYNEKAFLNLKAVKDSPYKNALLGILEYNLSRDR